MPSRHIAIILLSIGFLLLCVHAREAAAQPDSWSPVASMPTARERLVTCVIDGQIYAIGGAVAASSPGLSTNERYDPVSNTWLSRAPMPTPRGFAAAAAWGGKCYVFGGFQAANQNPLASVDIYDAASNSWSSGADMPAVRIAHAAAAVDGVIYVMGGTPDNIDVVDTLFAYDTTGNTWTTLAPMPTLRGVLAAVAVGGKVYAIGGTVAPGSHVDDAVEVYDPATNTWMAVNPLPTARAALAASVVNGRIYAIGGDGVGVALNSVEEFDPGSGTWTARAPMLFARGLLASAAADGRVFAIGGSTSTMAPHPGLVQVDAYTPPEGIVAFTVNAGMNDAWYNPATPGQGFFFNVFPDLGLVFFAWFTYDTERPAAEITAVLGEPGHRWLTAIGPFTGDTVTLDVELTEGGVFDMVPPQPVQTPAYGTVTVVFHDCSTGTLSYVFPSLGLSGEIPIQRIVQDNVPLCQALQ